MRAPPIPIALVALLVASAAAGTGDAAAAAPAGGGGAPVPPVCVGPGRALQWDGDRWRCATVGGVAGCVDRTRCTYLQPACPATWGGGYLVNAAPDPRCGGSEGRRCTYRVCPAGPGGPERGGGG